MKITTTTAIIFLTINLFLSLSFNDALAFRCGIRLVSAGDSKATVLATCGKPTSKEKACKENWTSSSDSKTKKKKCGEKVEVWYYNCGDNDFIYALTFEGNTLTGENTEGRGKGKSDCNGKR